MTGPPYLPGLAAHTSSVVFDATGKMLTGDVTIELMPGVGVTGPDGAHLDRGNGPHTVSVAFAAPLIASKRARAVTPPPAEAAGTPRGQVPGAPAGVLSRDPVIESRESGPRRGKR